MSFNLIANSNYRVQFDFIPYDCFKCCVYSVITTYQRAICDFILTG